MGLVFISQMSFARHSNTATSQAPLRYSLMKCDGGDLAFVCTKADVINTREVIQTLRLN